MPLTMGMLAAPSLIPPARAGTDTNDTHGVITSNTFSHTVPAGTNRVLVVVVCWGRNASAAVASVTWGGVGLAEAVDVVSNVGGQYAGVAVYYLDNAAVGTANIVVTYTDIVDSGTNYAMTYVGVDTAATPLAGSSTSTSNRSSGTFNLSPPDPATTLVGGGAAARVLTSWTPGSSMSEIRDGQVGGGGDTTYWVAERAEAAAGTFAFAGSLASGSASLALAAISLKSI